MKKTVLIYINDCELEAELTFEYTPSEAGVYHLAPEDCRPYEPEEYELTELVIDGEIDCTWMIDHIQESLIEQLGEDDE